MAVAALPPQGAEVPRPCSELRDEEGCVPPLPPESPPAGGAGEAQWIGRDSRVCALGMKAGHPAGQGEKGCSGSEACRGPLPPRHEESSRGGLSVRPHLSSSLRASSLGVLR